MTMPRLPWYFKLSYFFCLPAALLGCASNLPPCERYNYQIAEDNDGGVFILIDMENVVKLSAMLEGVSSGKCRIAKQGEI